MKISIIIPIYNAEKRLTECLDPVVTQTYKDIEVLLINDGSTDSSKEVCEAYAKNYSFVKVFNTKNQGVSMARNYGLEQAVGEYIQFIDADDIIDSKCTEVLISQIEQETSDLIICGYNKVKQNSSKKVVPEKGTMSFEQFMKKFGYLYETGFVNVVWNKLYKKEILTKYKIEFNSQQHYAEDLYFNLKYISVCQKISFVSKVLYTYFIHGNSATAKFREDWYVQELEQYIHLKNYLLDRDSWSHENQMYLDRMLTKGLVNCLLLIHHPKSNYTMKTQISKTKEVCSQFVVLENPDISLNSLGQKGRLLTGLMKIEAYGLINCLFMVASFIRNRGIAFTIK